MSSTSSSLVALPPEVPSSSSSFSSSPSFSTLESLALENFYQNYNHQDDPFKGRWECLYAGVDCNTVAFDWRGAYLAIGTADGHVSSNMGWGIIGRNYPPKKIAPKFVCSVALLIRME